MPQHAHNAIREHKSSEIYSRGFPGRVCGKESACQCRRRRVQSLGREWRRRWQPTPVSLPGKCREQRSLAGYSPWGDKRVGHNWATRQTVDDSLGSKRGLPWRLRRERIRLQCRRPGDPGSIPGSGRSPRGGHGNPLQCSCLENSIPWTEEPGGLYSIGSQRVGCDWSYLAHRQ